MLSLTHAVAYGIALLILPDGWANASAQTAGRHTVYESKMISSGHNRPTFNIKQHELLELCAELHRRIDPRTIRERHGWSEEDLASRIARLRNAGLVKEPSTGTFLPTFMVISMEDANHYLRIPPDLVGRTCNLILKRRPAILATARQIPGIKGRPYSAYSFFLFSDVLLDNWQINNVEHSILGSERPLRHGNRYYFAILEKLSGQLSEAFGIYGNGGATRNGKEVDVYGNDRYSGKTLISASDSDLSRWFPTLPNPAEKEFASELIAGLTKVATAGNAGAADDRMRSGMEKLGLIDHGDLNFLVLPRSSVDRLHDVANLIAPEFEDLLRKGLPELKTAYFASRYKDEVTFDEYFIWWYHFFYTRVTNQLAAKRILRIPTNGNITYLVVDPVE